ncbi:MAG: hypothetical protein KUG79_13865 [Pseudomonadales bacterium]|nr:hypothetical protein [Pseudomonadales bacterium]
MTPNKLSINVRRIRAATYNVVEPGSVAALNCLSNQDYINQLTVISPELPLVGYHPFDNNLPVSGLSSDARSAGQSFAGESSESGSSERKNKAPLGESLSKMASSFSHTLPLPAAHLGATGAAIATSPASSAATNRSDASSVTSTGVDFPASASSDTVSSSTVSSSAASSSAANSSAASSSTPNSSAGNEYSHVSGETSAAVVVPHSVLATLDRLLSEIDSLSAGADISAPQPVSADSIVNDSTSNVSQLATKNISVGADRGNNPQLLASPAEGVGRSADETLTETGSTDANRPVSTTFSAIQELVDSILPDQLQTGQLGGEKDGASQLDKRSSIFVQPSINQRSRLANLTSEVYSSTKNSHLQSSTAERQISDHPSMNSPLDSQSLVSAPARQQQTGAGGIANDWLDMPAGFFSPQGKPDQGSINAYVPDSAGGSLESVDTSKVADALSEYLQEQASLHGIDLS